MRAARVCRRSSIGRSALRGEHQIVRAIRSSSRDEERISGRDPIGASRARGCVTNGGAGRLATAHGCCVCRGDEGPVRGHLQRVPQLHGSSGGLDVGLYGSVDSLAADRDRWELILTKLKSREMPPDDATIAPSEEQIGGLVKFLESEFAARGRQHEARPWPRQRATFEQGRVHEHDPRPARDRVSRRQELPHRRFR